ncbi:MAG: O-acetyl-ADP-ribose deacetylase [Solobacterium sp.]|nr:O-acetyl-ADP-ribose deacetylase [Solobacterium sp.]
MSTVIRTIQGDITKINTVEAIVNAANNSLLGGGGVDGAIHRAAGPELLKECRKLHGCRTGEAKITGAYRLPCRYVIHTVGPVWDGGRNKEAELLGSCYRNSLKVAEENRIRTIAFPSVSTGVYGYPVERAASVAVGAVKEYVQEHPKAFDEIVWVLFDAVTKKAYDTALQEAEASSTAAVDDLRVQYCRKYIPLLEMIEGSPDLQTKLRKYYMLSTREIPEEIMKQLDALIKEAYASDIVVTDYRELVEEKGIEGWVNAPSEEKLRELDPEYILACIAWHFRRDYFDFGSLYSDSVANGYLLKMMKVYLEKME